jgi:hypothetical protein
MRSRSESHQTCDTLLKGLPYHPSSRGDVTGGGTVGPADARICHAPGVEGVQIANGLLKSTLTDETRPKEHCGRKTLISLFLFGFRFFFCRRKKRKFPNCGNDKVHIARARLEDIKQLIKGVVRTQSQNSFPTDDCLFSFFR